MLIDSHCHIDRVDTAPFGGSVQGVIEHAQSLGVEHMICVCIDMENYPAVQKIAEDFDCVSCSVGVHPVEDVETEPTFERLVEAAKHPKVVAIGETGLDYFHCKGDVTWQQDRFRTHIAAAKAADLPLIIHTRDAREDTIRIMKEEKVGPGVLHCFTETLEMAKAAIDLGFYISFSGIVTFKNALELQAVAKEIPLNRILVETDAPYLTPAPYRGKPNTPGYVRYVAEYLAELKGVSYEALCEVTGQNVKDLFTKIKTTS
jgi:TatD DNase family protein